MTSRCEQCGKPRLTENKFCGQCGKKFDNPSVNTMNPFIPNLDAYHALKEAIQLSAWKRNKKMLIVIPIGGVSVLLYLFLKHEGSHGLDFWMVSIALVLFGVGVLLKTLCVESDRNLYKSEYYKLPGSGGSKENHRCIFCGNKGIWRQGQYASSATYAHCSKCKAALFSE